MSHSENYLETSILRMGIVIYSDLCNLCSIVNLNTVTAEANKHGIRGSGEWGGGGRGLTDL